MLFTTLLLAGLATAAPALHSRQATTEYSPWEITRVGGSSPSGRPGSSPNKTLSITIDDPNTINLQRTPTGYAVFSPYNTTCSWTWDRSSDSSFPIGVETLCSPVDSTYGNFTMTLTAGTSQADFTIKIVETREVTVFKEHYVRVFEAEKTLKVGTGEDLTQICGGSGVCSWELKNGSVEVEQQLTTSVGTCEEASIGGC